MEDFDLLIFGGAGDLAQRKLLPALYYLARDGHLQAPSRILGVGRREQTDAAYREQVAGACRLQLNAEDVQEEVLQRFLPQVHWVQMDATGADYSALAGRLGDAERPRIFFLATPPRLFAPCCENLARAGLVRDDSRLVLEKPLGRDLASAQEIERRVAGIFSERQIFRIDHYLGKEAVQNLLALRFGNTLFEPLWRREAVSDVQITVAEQVGAGGRADFYDHNGALRDMVQSHLLQLLCIFAMEPPVSIEADAVRNEKLKVLHALKPLHGELALQNSVRGQYRSGAIAGTAVPGYLDEDGVASQSQTETFVALRAEINTWRWAGVPFYLRTGKRLQERLAELVVNFRPVPTNIFGDGRMAPPPNRLVIRLHPQDGVRLHVQAKRPGMDMRLKPVHLHLDFADAFSSRPLEAYERLFLEIIQNRLTLFMRNDELESAWRWIDPIQQAWCESEQMPRPYTAGSWGPSASATLLARGGHTWHEETNDDA